MKKGSITHGSLFSLRFMKSIDNKGHFGVVVAKKVAKTAVLRNKIRRRAYSILKKTVKNPYFAILFAKKGVEKASFADVKADIEKLTVRL